MKCLICGKYFKKLGIHIKFKHKKEFITKEQESSHIDIKKEYYDKFLKKENEGFCLVCKKKTKFQNLKVGYARFCSSKCASNFEFSSQKKVLPLKIIEKELLKNGFKLLTKENEYTSSTLTKLKYTCPKGHVCTNFLATFRITKKCSICSQNNKRKKSFQKVKKICKEKSFELNSNESDFNNDLIIFTCSKGHKVITNKKRFLESKRCKFCSYNEIAKKSSSKRKKSFKKIKSEFKKRNCILITKKESYKNAKTKLKYICENGHMNVTCWGDFQQGHGCKICALKVRDKKLNKKMFSYVKDQMLKLNVKFLDKKYINANFKHNLKCLLCGFNFKKSWFSIQQGCRCPKCFPTSCKISKGEKDVLKFVTFSISNCFCESKKNYDIMSNVKNVLVNKNNYRKNKELDIYIPDLKLAFEYNGLRWHSEKFGCDYNYHLNKTLLCNDLGIRLIHIFEDEWIHNKKSMKILIEKIIKKDWDLLPENDFFSLSLNRRFCKSSKYYEKLGFKVKIVKPRLYPNKEKLKIWDCGYLILECTDKISQNHKNKRKELN